MAGALSTRPSRLARALRLDSRGIPVLREAGCNAGPAFQEPDRDHHQDIPTLFAPAPPPSVGRRGNRASCLPIVAGASTRGEELVSGMAGSLASAAATDAG